MGSAAVIAVAGALLLLHLSTIKSEDSALPHLTQKSTGFCTIFVDQNAYNCQEFVVQTEDGFLLGVQRLTARSAAASKGPAFLYHGLFLGGDIWVMNQPSESLAFILADAGYAVWIGNTRTTTFSYGHTSFTQHDQGFWDWCLDELARYDVPAMLKFVYSKSGQKIYYIGYSQGTQAAFAALSQGQQLLDIVEKFVMLAPVAYVNHATTPIGVAAVKLYADKILMALHINFFTFRSKTGRQLVDYICASMNMRCYGETISLLTGDNCCINATRRAFYDKYELQATSTKNLRHLAQQFRTGTFSQYDYGWWGNMQRYGSFNAPDYKLSHIPSNIKMMLIAAEKDSLATPPDVQHLLNELSYRPTFMSIPNYAHLDFVVGINANVDAYAKAMSFFQSQ
ncbi:hypothetical protein O6H91_04G070000 [Diphasiastrum complanatum]|uniref:Uncharacterized protein n=1 Tax=Diphasiastrum complanatum TaxID=34168 RepID=A0ACC2DY32_DIPCM|nr:hypothetical protein O6H91_04G070000 [Diphasiastrum complanatum]